jgi:hypothetical protein
VGSGMEDGGWRMEEGGGMRRGRKGAARTMGATHEASAQLRFGGPNPGKESGNVLSEGDVECDPRGISDRPCLRHPQGALIDHPLLIVAPSMRQAPTTCPLPARMADDAPRDIGPGSIHSLPIPYCPSLIPLSPFHIPDSPFLSPHSPFSIPHPSPSSPIPYPLSIISHPLSPIPHPLSLIPYPLSPIPYPLSLIPYRFSIHPYPLSPIPYPLSPLHFAPAAHPMTGHLP